MQDGTKKSSQNYLNIIDNISITKNYIKPKNELLRKFNNVRNLNQIEDTFAMSLRPKVKKTFILPLVAIIFLFVFEVVQFFQPSFLGQNINIKKWLFLTAIPILFNGIKNWHQQVSIYAKVKILFLYLMIMACLDFILKRIDFTSSTQQFLFTNLILILIYTFLILLIFSLIRDLIFIQRKKATARNFILLVIFILLYSYFGTPGNTFSDIQISGTKSYKLPEQGSAIFMICAVLMIYASVINSFRSYWVKFLNKKEKIKTFFLGGLSIALGILIIRQEHQVLMNYSYVAANFFTASCLFLLVYLSISSLVILLHLPTAGFLDRKVKELSSLQQLSRMILGVFDLEKVMQIITEQTIEITGANFCWLLIRKADSRQLDLVAHKEMPSSLIDAFSQNPRTDIVKWIEKNKSVLMIDRIEKNDLTATAEGWHYKRGSLLGIPFISNAKVMGILFAGKYTEYGFLADDKALLTMFANNAAMAIENARLVEKSLEQEMYEQELKIAHEAQMKLLPGRMPELKSIEIEATCKTANEVGGDYYDFYQFDKTKLGVIIGDVSGKGAEAAFYMAEAKGILESFSSIYFSPKELLTEANKILYNTLDKKTFISVLYGIFDLKKKTFTFCRAGHCPLLYWNSQENEIYLIEPAGLALGLDPDKNFKNTLAEEQFKFYPGDIFIFFTDGINEARNLNQDEFEEQRLCDVVIDNHGKNATAIKNAILEKIEHFVGEQSQHDDLTMIVLIPR